jgi:hypothetical protein
VGPHTWQLLGQCTHGTIFQQSEIRVDAGNRVSLDGVKPGGIGYGHLKFSGNVYNLTKLEDFDGDYFSTEASAALVEGKGGFWMKNDKGVSIHLSGSSEGVAPGLGVEGVGVSLLK